MEISTYSNFRLCYGIYRVLINVYNAVTINSKLLTKIVCKHYRE